MSMRIAITTALFCSITFAGIGDYVSEVTSGSSTVSSVLKNEDVSSVIDGLSDAKNISATLSNSTTSKTITSIFGALGVTNDFFIQPIKIPGVAGLNIECDFPDEASNLSFDICDDVLGEAEDGIIDGLNSVFDTLKKGVQIGPCRTGVEIRKICRTDILKDSCNRVRSAADEVAKGIEEVIVESTPVQVVSSSIEEMMQYGETLVDKYFEDSVEDTCAAILPKERMKAITIGKSKKPLAVFYDEKFSADNIINNAYAKTSSTSVYSPRLYDWKQCVLANPDNTEVCDLKNTKLPEDYKAVQKEIQTMKVALGDGMEKTNTFETITLLSNNYLSECKEGETQATCEQRIYDEGYTVIDSEGKSSIIKLKEVKERQNEDAERSVIYFANILNSIKNENVYYGFMSEDIAQKIPLQKRAQFRRKALIEMKKESLFGYFIEKIMYAKKEVIDIEHNLIKISSAQFNAEEALKEVEAVIASFEANAQ